MSNQRRPKAQQSSLAAARARNPAGVRGRQNRTNRTIWLVAAVVAVVSIAAVAALASGGTKHASPPTTPATVKSVAAKATSIPASVFSAVGKGSTGGLPKKIDAPPSPSGAKPNVLYIGAEYYPYCATERWPLVLALSRFGTFSHLSLTHSSSDDVYPDTQTFSFHGSTYQSQYLSFEAVEEKTNQLVGDDYGRLDTPTAEQQRIFTTYNAPRTCPPVRPGRSRSSTSAASTSAVAPATRRTCCRTRAPMPSPLRSRNPRAPSRRGSSAPPTPSSPPSAPSPATSRATSAQLRR